MTMKDFTHTPIVRIKALAGLVAIGAGVMLLTGCGSSSDVTRSCTINGEMRPFSECEDLGNGPSLETPGGIPAAARNVPRTGQSIAQSSVGTNGVTDNDVSVDISYNPDGSVTYEVSNGEWSLGSEDPDTTTSVNRRVTRPQSGVTATLVNAFEGRGRTTPGGVTGSEGTTAFQFLTDIESATDPDYLVWGVWLTAPEGATRHEHTDQGAFATGSDPFEQNNLAGLTGSATYQGDADGIYFRPDSPPGGNSFAANAELTAEFGDGSDLGTIEGRIDDFHFFENGQFESDPTAELTLGQTPIGGSNSGFFTGATSGSAQGENFTGNWGGQFYGNGQGQPTGVAGTFGATNADDSAGVIGAFGARKQ